jgi:hypothetical protein
MRWVAGAGAFGFNPTVVGPATGTLTIYSNAAGSPHVIQLAGTGLTATSLTLVDVYSRKTHASAGTYDLVIDTAAPLHGAVTVEPRFAMGGHRIVFDFNGPVAVPGSALVVDDAGQTLAAHISSSDHEVTVLLPNVPDRTRVQITLNGVNGSAGGVAAIGFLVGDVNDSGKVNSGDIAAVKARLSRPANGGNFEFDVNLSGVITQSDLTAVKSRAGWRLP